MIKANKKYDDIRQDADLAHLVAHGEEPFRVELEKAYRLGGTAAIATLEQASATTVAAIKKSYVPTERSETQPEPVKQPESHDKEEKGFSKEDLTEVMEEATAFVSLYARFGYTSLLRRARDDREKPNLTPFERQYLHLADIDNSQSDAEASLANRGVAELAQFKSNKDLATIHYSTTQWGGASGKYPYTPYGNLRPGHQLKATVLLSAEKGRLVWEEIQKDPELARHMVGLSVDTPGAMYSPDKGIFGSCTWWEKQHDGEDNSRPPYELWRANDGGVSRMAFVENQQPIVDAKIIEF